MDHLILCSCSRSDWTAPFCCLSIPWAAPNPESCWVHCVSNSLRDMVCQEVFPSILYSASESLQTSWCNRPSQAGLAQELARAWSTVCVGGWPGWWCKLNLYPPKALPGYQWSLQHPQVCGTALQHLCTSWSSEGQDWCSCATWGTVIVNLSAGRCSCPQVLLLQVCGVNSSRN